MIKMMIKIFACTLVVSIGLLGNVLAAEEDVFSNQIEKIDFSTLSGGRVSIRVQLKEPLANPPAGFTLNNPSRIALDFPKTRSVLK